MDKGNLAYLALLVTALVAIFVPLRRRRDPDRDGSAEVSERDENSDEPFD